MPRPWPLDSASPTVWCANTSFGRCSAVVNTWIASAMIDSRSHRSTDIERDPTHLAAAEWFVRLHGSEVSIEETLAWQAWLRESPDNARAFARLEELSDVLRSLSLPGRISARDDGCAGRPGRRNGLCLHARSPEHRGSQHFQYPSGGESRAQFE